MRKEFILLTSVIIFCAFTVNASPVKFYSINSVFGISMREANSVCKDGNGFIWASSKTGILRLTKSDYRIYQLPYETVDVLTVRLIFNDLKLFAYTNNGQVFSYNRVYDRFDLLFNLSKILNNNYLSIANILIDDTGTFWIASSAGLYKYQSDKLSLIDEISPERYSIIWYDNQSILIVGSKGIWLFDIHSLKNSCLYDNGAISSLNVSKLFLDKVRNKLWIGTISSGLFRYDFSSKSFSGILKSHFPRQPVLALEENSDSTILVGVDGQGIWELDKSGNHVLNVYKENSDDQFSLHGNGVYDLFCDQDKRVWICTFSGGLSYFDQTSPLINQIVHQTNNANSLINNDVNCLIEDHWGKIWFATNNGVSCWNVSTNQWKHFYNNKLEQAQVFLSLCEDGKGRIWAGSYSSGVYVLDGKTGKELAHYWHDGKDSPLVSNFILDIYRDSHGDIWIGGVNGEFICYLPKENKFRTYSREPIALFAELSANQILLGCSYGLALINKETGDIRKILVGYVVQDILILGEDIWICTNGEGLLRFDYRRGVTEKIDTKSGLPSNFLKSIEYADNYLWLGTENGICRLDLRDKNVLTYPSILPLSHLSYNRGAHFKLKNGQLAWGTNNGALIFTPRQIKETQSEGKIFFQDLTISGRSIREIPTFKLNAPVDSLKSIALNYPQNNLGLDLLPVGIPSGAKFSWRLDGFDNNWTAPTGNRSVSYTNLPSGRFVLKVILYDSSLSQVMAERSLSIRVIPPFWKRNWFLLLVVIAISGIVFLCLLYYVNKLKQKHAEEKVRFFTDTAHDIRTSLTLIKAPVEELNRETNLSEAGRHYLQLANKQAERLSTVITQLMDFQKVDVGKEQLSLTMVDIARMISNRRLVFDSFAKSKNIELEFITDHDSYITAVDESKMEKVIDNLISNAVKYSFPGSKVQIDLKCDEKKWVFQVKDNGIGISRKAQRQLFKEFYRGDNAINSKVVGSGIGLLLAKNYVTMHGGTIHCDSQENVGSTFEVVLDHKTITNDIKMENPIEGRGSAFILSPGYNLLPPVIDVNHPLKEMSVLIVEDNEDLLHFLQNTLSRDFKVDTAEDGVKAWNCILKQMPDLIVSDVMMPNMDGFELCKLIKSTYETAHIPVILLTALSEKAEQLHGLGLGADDYLTKPFDTILLIQRIKSIIRNREAVREKALKLISGNSAEPLLANKLNDKFVKKMLEVVQTNISNPEFDKDEFASAMNVSSSLLYKKIKSLTGQSPTDFVKTIRLSRALELLQTRSYTITEVSELCGFASVGYFSTVFRKHYGESPTEILDRGKTS